MRIISTLLVCTLSFALTAACGGGGGGIQIIPGGSSLLTIQSWATGGSDITLNLRGPNAAGSTSTVTYYVFGSHDSLGDDAIVPLQSERLDEQPIATLGAQEVLDAVDLTPWDAYEFIYLRALSVTPNRIHLLAPGNIYQFGVL